MATAYTSSFLPSSRQPASHVPALAIAAPAAPSGTFAPGTKVQVGDHRVVIEKYLSEGGFAHVYLVRLPKPVYGDDQAVLKRVAVPDKEALASMRNEVETMKKLKGRRHIVTYVDSHASQLREGGYEVFLLMEYCNGGGLMDFMNTRLKNRLTEPEILSIFYDVAQGVADMHYLKPPLLHRDLKVENVLINSSGSSRRYKLCDFGSAAAPTPAATNAAEGRLIEDDVQKHTTPQYRSPEMIDVYRKQAIDEKSDIWALGVLLYKLCYYKTPFEDQGQMAILNARFKFPGYPPFSDDLKKLIASMLRESPHMRPNIYQVVQEVCLMRGTDIPIKDIYAARTPSEARRNQHLPTPQQNIASPPMVGAYQVPLVEEKRVIPDIVPMRRGRPVKTELEHKIHKPLPSPMRGITKDPFEALDSTSSIPINGFDDVSSRFPALDEFSILHDSGSKFAFVLNSEPINKTAKDIRERVTDALADDAFARPSVSDQGQAKPSMPTHHLDTKLEEADLSNAKLSQLPSISKDLPSRPEMVSTGTMTSPSPPSTNQKINNSPLPIFRVPASEHGSSSQPQGSESSKLLLSNLKSHVIVSQRPSLRDQRSKSQLSTLSVAKSTNSSRPSLEGQRPTMLDTTSTINRSKSASSRVRPSSVHNEIKKPLLRSREVSRDERYRNEPQERYRAEQLAPVFTSEPEKDFEASKISSDVDFLRAMEEQDPLKRREKRVSSGSKHIKRASMPSISLSGTKSLLAGRFGDAFRRFETNAGGSSHRGPSPSPLRGDRDLTPIAGSEATDGRSDDGHGLEETEPISAEVRRELERRRLSQEEKRVTDAAAAYRQRFTEKNDDSRGIPGEGQVNSRAVSIQSKVKSLLDETGRASPSIPDKEHRRLPSQPQPITKAPDEAHSRSLTRQQPILKKSLPPTKTHTQPSTNPITPPDNSLDPHNKHYPPPPASTLASSTHLYPPRPSAPPKPYALRTGANRDDPAPPPPLLPTTKPPPSLLATSSALASTTILGSDPAATTTIPPPPDRDDWEKTFSRKYPALAGLEMVETEIDPAGGGGGPPGRRGDV